MASITADRKGKQHFLLQLFFVKKKQAVIVPYSHIKSHYPSNNGCKNSVSTLG